jgi:hypothetical protein
MDQKPFGAGWQQSRVVGSAAAPIRPQMKEVYTVGDRLFSVMIAVDVLVANLWMACLLFASGRSKQIDARVGPDTSTIDEVKTKVEEFRSRIARIPALNANGFAHHQECEAVNHTDEFV